VQPFLLSEKGRSKFHI